MKTEKILLLGLVFILQMGLFSCDEKQIDEILEKEEAPALTISDEAVAIVVGSTQSIAIEQGAGAYKVFSLNEEIAQVELVENRIVIEALRQGNTSVMVSDKNSRFRKISIKSYYDKITVDKPNLKIQIKVGNPAVKIVRILEGNGNYTATSDNEELTVTVNENNLTIIATEEAGNGTITVTDAEGVKLEIPVTIETTTIPYNAEEMAEIKTDGTLRYVYNESGTENALMTGYQFINSTENGVHRYGWNYYTIIYLYLYFTGDKEVGVKEGTRIDFKDWSSSSKAEPINLEIIKNDGTKIWAIFSYLENGKLNYGHFCQKINP